MRAMQLLSSGSTAYVTHLPFNRPYVKCALVAETKLSLNINKSLYYAKSKVIIMETEFYEPPYSARDSLKKRLSLDLNSPRVKKARFDVLLTSPDLKMLKLPSPELDRLLLQQGGLPSSTSSQLINPFSFPNPRITNHTQLPQQQQQLPQTEIYTRGLSETLLDLTDSTPQVLVTQHGFGQSESPAFGATSNFTNHDFQIAVKEESQMFGSSSDSPLVSPIDLDSQERIKIERKRQRNRIAASKCRKRKLERIAKLEDRVKHLKTENVELAAVIHKLRQQVCGLKEQVLDHVSSGCHIVMEPLY